MSSAMTPPMAKKASEVTRYMRPMTLGSVVRSIMLRYEPLAPSCSG